MKKVIIGILLILAIIVAGCTNNKDGQINPGNVFGPKIELEKLLYCYDEPNNLVEGFCKKDINANTVKGETRLAFVGLGLKNLKCESNQVSVNCAVKVYTRDKTILDDSTVITDRVEGCDKLKPEKVKGVCFASLNNLHLLQGDATYFVDLKATDNYTNTTVELKENKLEVSPVRKALLGSLGLELPDGWFLTKFDDQKYEYRFSTSSKDAEMIVWIASMPADANQETYTEEIFNNFTQGIPGYELIGKGKIKIDKRETDYIRYKSTQDGLKLIVQDMLLFKARNHWFIDFTATEEKFEEKLQDLNKLIQGMKVV